MARFLLCLGALLAGRVAAGLESVVVIGEVHENVTLPCGNISGPRGLVAWYRNDSQPTLLVSSEPGLPPAKTRFSLALAGSLLIEAPALQDEGNYTCRELDPLNQTRWFGVELLMASGPDQLEVDIAATGTLPNGTLYAAKGSEVTFSCSSHSSWPPPMIEWCFGVPGSKGESFRSHLSISSFSLIQMSHNLQGNYTCTATNVRSGRLRKVTSELLVYCA